MKKTLPLVLCLLLQACGTPPSKPPAELPKAAVASSWEQHKQQLASLQQWQAEGRFAVNYGQKGNNASFVWTQNGDNFKIKLFGPFGSGAVYINGNSKSVELRETNGKIRTAKTPEELLQKVAGWSVPLSGLHYWLRGIPTPKGKVTSHQINAQGYLQQLHQDGWHIQYENYEQMSPAALPSKMQLESPKCKVKMVIKSWKV